MSENQSKKHEIPSEIMENAQLVMELLAENFSTPPEALFATVLAVAVLAKGAQMPLQVLVDGIAAAYDDLDALSLGTGARAEHGHH